MKLYGHEISGHAYKVALTLELADINYDYERVDILKPRETRSPEFLAASKWAEVPCLVRDGKSMIQSGAILLMLAREYNALNSKDKIDACAEWVNWEANRIGMCIPQLIWAKLAPQDVPEGAQKWLRGRLETDVNRLASALGDAPFLLGDEISVADTCVFGYVSKIEAVYANVPKEIIDWISRITKLTGFQTANKLLGNSSTI